MAVNHLIRFSNLMGTTLIRVGAGNNQAQFHIHTDLLVTVSPFFATFLKKPLKEFCLSNEYTAAAFELFCQWLYHQTDPISKNTSDEDCVDALLLGLLLKVPSFANICKKQLDSRLREEYVNGFFKLFEVPTLLNDIKFFRKVLIDEMAKKAAGTKASTSTPFDLSGRDRLNHLSETSAGHYKAKMLDVVEPSKRLKLADLVNTSKSKGPSVPGAFATNTIPTVGLFQTNSSGAEATSFQNSHIPPITLPFPIASSNNYPTFQSFQSTEKPGFRGFGGCLNCKGGGAFDFKHNRCATCGQTQTLSNSGTNTNLLPAMTDQPFGRPGGVPTTAKSFSHLQTSATSQAPSSPFTNTPFTATSPFGMPAKPNHSCWKFDTRLPAISTSNNVPSYPSFGDLKTHQTPGSSPFQSKWGNTQNPSPFATHTTLSRPPGGLFANTNAPSTTNIFTQTNTVQNQPMVNTSNSQSCSSAAAANKILPFEEQDSLTKTTNHYQSINAHPALQSISPEELRYADYSAGRSSKPNIVEKNSSNQAHLQFILHSNNFPTASGSLGPTWKFNQVAPKVSRGAATTTATTLPIPNNTAKPSQDAAQTAGDTQGQLNALTKILTNLVVDVNQRLSALEAELASQSSLLRQQTLADEQKRKLDTTKSEETARSETERHSLPGLKIKADEADRSPDVNSLPSSIASTPELIMTPTTTNPDRSSSIEPVVNINLDDSDDEDDFL